MDQLDLLRRQVALQQAQRHVVGTGVKLDGDGFVAQGSGVVMVGLWPHHNGLAGHRGSQGYDSGSLLALIGPTDLTLFSSAVDRDPGLLKGGVSQYRVHIFGVFRGSDHANGLSANELHIDALSLKQAVVLGHHPGQAENRAADFTDYFFHVDYLFSSRVPLELT